MFQKIIGLSPFAIMLAHGAGLLPEQYEGWARFGIIICAVLYCVLLYNLKERAMDLALLPALVCVLYGLNAAYDFFQYDYGTVGYLFDSFCAFICGVWIFAYTLKAEKK